MSRASDILAAVEEKKRKKADEYDAQRAKAYALKTMAILSGIQDDFKKADPEGKEDPNLNTAIQALTAFGRS